MIPKTDTQGKELDTEILTQIGESVKSVLSSGYVHSKFTISRENRRNLKVFPICILKYGIFFVSLHAKLRA